MTTVELLHKGIYVCGQEQKYCLLETSQDH